MSIQNLNTFGEYGIRHYRTYLRTSISLSLSFSIYQPPSFSLTVLSSFLPFPRLFVPLFFANEDDNGTAPLSHDQNGGRNRFSLAWPFLRNYAQSDDSDGISFFFPADPFADAIKGSDDDVQDGLVHIRIQQRNGRKTLTTVQGLSSEYDLKKIVRACKKVSTFSCAIGDFRQSLLLSICPHYFLLLFNPLVSFFLPLHLLFSLLLPFPHHLPP